jgi:flagellar biosynthesis protein FliR
MPIVPLLRALQEFDLASWALAWARVLPTILLVPAFGLGALALPLRLSVGLVLAASVAPALRPVAAAPGSWPLLLLEEALRGLPVALAAATALWAATMAGGLIDNLRGTREPAALPNVESGATPTGVLLSMLAAIAFLETGGAARVAAALVEPAALTIPPLARAAFDLASGIELAVAVAAPLLVVAIVAEVALGLLLRASGPDLLASVAAPLRSLLILGAAALLLDRMLELLVLASRRAL